MTDGRDGATYQQSVCWQALLIAALFCVSGRELSGQLSMTWLPNDSHSSWTGDCPEREKERNRMRLKMAGLRERKSWCTLLLQVDQAEREREAELYKKE